MDAIETLKQLLTCNSRYTTLGDETLLGIRCVTCFSPSPLPISAPEVPAKPGNKLKQVFSIHYTPASPPSKSTKNRENIEEMEENEAFCPLCSWHFPAIFSSDDRQRHISLKTCQMDKADYRKLLSEVRKMATRLEKEPILTTEDAEMSRKYRDLKNCPKCKKGMEGFWGQFKKRHMEECREGDREVIIGRFTSLANINSCLPY